MKLLFVITLLCTMSFSVNANQLAYCLGYADSLVSSTKNKKTRSVLKFYEKKVTVLNDIDKEYYIEGNKKSNPILNKYCIDQYNKGTLK